MPVHVLADLLQKVSLDDKVLDSDLEDEGDGNASRVCDFIA